MKIKGNNLTIMMTINVVKQGELKKNVKKRNFEDSCRVPVVHFLLD
ncbi:MAG: hypothetical protein IJH12_07295 [Clostridia bacterium]|nr:hypothetical protein [Clostridia bacterium]